MTLENMLRNAKRQDPKGFARALAAMDAEPRRSRFSSALKKRFGGDPKRVLAALGMDENLLGEIHAEREKSRSVLDDERAKKMMSEHGHADADFDAMDNDWRQFGRDCGLSEDDLDTLWSMIPRKQRIEGEDDETEQQERQRRLESAEREVSPRHERSDREAARREMEGEAEQSEDRMPSRRRGFMPQNRFAHDSDMAFIDEVLGKQPEVFVGGNSRSWRLEEAAQREVERVRRLAGVGSGMGLDAKQSRSRSERLIAATAQLGKHGGEVRKELIEMFGEHFGRITIAP
jgi:hypothetical protein